MRQALLNSVFLLLSTLLIGQNWKSSYGVAKEKFDQGEFSTTREILSDIIKENRQTLENKEIFFEIYTLLGITELNLKNYASSESALKVASDYYVNNACNSTALLAYSYYGNLLFALNKFDESAPIFAKAGQCSQELSGLNETSLTLTKNAGVSYFKQKQYATALQQFVIVSQELEKHPEWKTIDKSEVYLSQARSLIGTNDFIEALTALDAAEKAFNPNTSSPTKKAILSEKGRANSYLKNYERAENNYRLLLSQLSKDDETYFNTIIDLATVLKLQEKHHDITTTLLEFQFTRTDDNSIQVAQYHRILADAQRVLGHYNKSSKNYKEAEYILRKSGLDNTNDYGQVLNGYALLNDALGDFEQAESYYLKDLDIINKTAGRNSTDYAQSISNLGLLYLKMARYARAEQLLKEALKLRKEQAQNSAKIVEAQNNLAFAYLKLGQLKRAERLYLEAKVMSENLRLEKSTGYAAILSNLGSLAEQNDNYDQAKDYYAKALAVTEKTLGKNHPQYASAINNLALVAQYQGQYDESAKLYLQYLEFTKKQLGNAHPNYATGLINYAQLLERQEKYALAKQTYEEALSIRKRALGPAHPDYNNVIHHLCRVLTVLEEYAKADLLWKEIISNYHEQIDEYFPFLSEKERRDFYYSIKEELEQFNAYALLRYENAPELLTFVYDNQLKTKALLLNSRNQVKNRIAESNNAQLQQDYEAWQELRENYAEVFSLSISERNQRNINIDSLHNAINELEKSLSTSSEDFRTSNEKKRVSWKTVKRQLSDNEAAVELIRMTKYDFTKGGTYTENEIYYLALIVRPDLKRSPELVVFNNGFDLEGRLANYYRNATRYSVDDEYSYKSYWEPIKKHLNDVTRVFIAPDKVYNKINLNSIRNHETGQFIVDEITLKYVTSTRDLIFRKSSNKKPNEIILVGNPTFSRTSNNQDNRLKSLPGTQKEVEHIASLTNSKGWRTEIDTGLVADEEHIKNITNIDVLHIATHGFFDNDYEVEHTNHKRTTAMDSPLLHAGLYFAGAEETLNNSNRTAGEDGILSAYEAMNLNLTNTELVVLSACETGQGSIRNGEAVYGLQRAFMEAGAKSLIVSLWKVNDAATDKLMSTFYQLWLSGSDKTSAFRQAQRELRKTYKEPYYWGAFILVGAS